MRVEKLVDKKTERMKDAHESTIVIKETGMPLARTT
jgi:hypothetical protein